MILLLGASGFIGRTFASELRRRGHSFIPLTRRAFDYSRFDFLFDYVRTMKPVFVINAASYHGSRKLAGAGGEREKMVAANAILPQMIARVCSLAKTPWGHVSSGDVYSGAKVLQDGSIEIVNDLTAKGWRKLFDHEPGRFHGFTEVDEPNFTFRTLPPNFFSGTKALAEEAIREIGQSYIWRPRMLFNDKDEPCNLLHRLQQQAIVYDDLDSASHVEDFVKAALDLWEVRAPFGVYNMTNPGVITTGQLAEGLQRVVRPALRIKVCPPEEDPERRDGAVPHSHCLLDTAKLLKTGVRIRPVHEALKEALDKLRAGSRPVRGIESPPLSPLATQPAPPVG